RPRARACRANSDSGHLGAKGAPYTGSRNAFWVYLREDGGQSTHICSFLAIVCGKPICVPKRCRAANLQHRRAKVPVGRQIDRSALLRESGENRRRPGSYRELEATISAHAGGVAASRLRSCFAATVRAASGVS